MSPAPLTVGTAGHIDHGKTTLVRALTGRDTDRLAEERRRGMSIELGFAELDLGSRRCSLVDVPGHERFVRTMVAGASGIDLFLLVVAADDGVMPQTHEHLAVLRALGVEAGVVAVTKIDLVDPDTRALAAAECAALLPQTPVVPVCGRSGEGLEALRAALAAAAAQVDRADRADRAHGALPPPPPCTLSPSGLQSAGGAVGAEDEAPVLHVDRSFTIAGHGTVVTGTLWSGLLRRGQRVVLLPSGRAARVRSIEVHDRDLETAEARQRVALNLAGLHREEIRRGDVVTVADGPVRMTYRLDAELTEGAAEIARQRRVQVHLGTREAPARVVDLGEGAVQLRLESPLLARHDDRVVIRRIAPPYTLGGGVVRDPSPPRHGPGWDPKPPKPQENVNGGHSRGLADRVAPTAAENPGELAQRLLAELRSDGAKPSGAAALAERAGVERREVEAALRELVAAGAAVRVKPDVLYPAATYARLREAIVALAERQGSVSLAEARDALGLSRKYAQALLEHLDGEKVLRRDGERHYPRGPARR
ncbi:MAG TPA: SelB C-terminal domain-containing protein [Solirubrobacterales bacterium]|jgi:selenocysteine-specific elongation factor|nr:SelB C-terminal domain-containing protein [Solirubrobacterales bacterium]